VSAPGNYNTTFNSANLTIAQAPLAINATAANKTYGTTDPTLSYTNTGLVNGVTVDGVTLNDTISGSLTRTSYGTLAGEQVGTFAINPGSVAASDPTNYTTTFNTANLTINKAALAIDATAASKTYGTNDPTLSYTNSGLVNGVTVDGVTINDTLSGSLARASYGTLAGEQVGTFAINQGTVVVSAPGNYNTTFNSANLTIAKATLSINATSASKNYGTADPALTYITSGLVNATVDGVAINDTAGSVLTGSLTRAQYGTLAGEQVANSPFAITQGTLAANGNYNINFASNNLTITHAATSLNVTANGQTKVYGVNDPVFTYNATGFINTVVDGVAINDNAGNSLTGALGRIITSQTDENIGLHTILQNTLAASNYTINYNSANLLINKAPLTINANPQSKVYGTNDPALTYTQIGLITNTIVDGILINDTLSGALTRTPGQNVGSYPILQGTLAASNNYSTTFNTSNLSITPAMLAASLTGSVTKTYDTTNTATLTASNYVLSGVIGGDSVTLNNPTSGLYDNANAGSNKNVTVTGLAISGVSASNYQLGSISVNANIGQINPFLLNTMGVIAENKAYNGSVAAILDTSAAALTGIFASDSGNVFISGNGTGFFASPAAGNNIPVTATYIPYSGSASGNYSINLPTGLSASIIPPNSPPIPPIPPVPGATTIAQVIMPTNQNNNTQNNQTQPQAVTITNIQTAPVVKTNGNNSCVDLGTGISICGG
ncbi:MAG: beta strand repeat-containing protein, partial [Gammaproteobacteria bacterium]